MPQHQLTIVPGLALALAACAPDREPGGDLVGTATGGGSSSDSSGDDGAVRFDVASATESTGGATPGDGVIRCSMIDFLFVIDNSVSMGGSQQSLTTSFPGFIDAIGTEVYVDSFHILVTDSDWDGGTQLTATTGCADLCAGKTQGSCNNQPCNPNVTCDGIIGAGKRLSKNGEDCGIVGTARYLDHEQPDLIDTFACIAEVGTEGSSVEMTMQATLSALTDEVQPGGCNEGFLRNNALLVITFVTDEAHEHSFPMGGPPDWAQTIIDAKRGNGEAIVTMAMISDRDLPEDEQYCTGSIFQGAPLYREWALEFPYGEWGSICAPDYAPFFRDAISIINTACENYIPP